jgi:hypothetical protein
MKPHSKDRMIIIKAAVCLTLVGSAWALYAIGWRQHPMAGSWELVECRWRSPGGEIEVYRESDRITLCPTLFPDVYWLYGPKGLAGDTFWRIRQGQDVMLFESISAGEIIYSGLQLTKPNSRLGIAKLEKNVLTICYQMDLPKAVRQRPKSFDLAENDISCILLVLKKVE